MPSSQYRTGLNRHSRRNFPVGCHLVISRQNDHISVSNPAKFVLYCVIFVWVAAGRAGRHSYNTRCSRGRPAPVPLHCPACRPQHAIDQTALLLIINFSVRIKPAQAHPQPPDQCRTYNNKNFTQTFPFLITMTERKQAIR